MTGYLAVLSLENVPAMGEPPPGDLEPSATDLQDEFRKLEGPLQQDAAGNDKFLDACFSFLAFCAKHTRQLRPALMAANLKLYCMRLFSLYVANRERLQNDARFVQCMMWFGMFHPRVYKDVIDKGIGNRCSVTYVMYARSLARQGNTAAAIGVIRRGLEAEALPIAYLEDTLRELQGGSTVLQPKENGSVVSAINIQQQPQATALQRVAIDPYNRYSAEARDFGPDYYRRYDFRAVYPEFSSHEFQFEERRLQVWREKRKSEDERKATQKAIAEKDEVIRNLQESIARLQREKVLMVTQQHVIAGTGAVAVAAAGTEPSPVENAVSRCPTPEQASSSRRPSRSLASAAVVSADGGLEDAAALAFDDNTNTDDTIPLTSTQKPVGAAPVSETHASPTEEEDATTTLLSESHGDRSERESTTAVTNKTGMMTRDMRELFWNGTLNSTNMAPSADVTPYKVAASEGEEDDDDDDNNENIGRNEDDAGSKREPQQRLAVFVENAVPPREIGPTPDAQSGDRPASDHCMVAVFDENQTRPKRKSVAPTEPAKRFASYTDENLPGPSSRPVEAPAPLKLKVFDENPGPTESIKDDDEFDKENVAPIGYQQPPLHVRRTAGVLVDAEGFETAPASAFSPEVGDEDDDDAAAGSSRAQDSRRPAAATAVASTHDQADDEEDEDLGVCLLDVSEGGSSEVRFQASTPTKNDPGASETTWRVTELLRDSMLPALTLAEGGAEVDCSPQVDSRAQRAATHVSVRQLSTILEASKESGSSSSSNSLGTPSLARSSCANSPRDDSLCDKLNPVISEPFNPAHRNKVILGSKITYETVEGNLPYMKKNTTISYSGGYQATIVKLIGEGGYAKVYFAQRHLDMADAVPSEEAVGEPTTCIVRDDQAAIKITKQITAGLWEYYVLRSISSRLAQLGGQPCIRKSIPEPHCAAYYKDGFLISLPFLPYGSLVDLVNTFDRSLSEELARYLVLELMVITMRLHETGIIHGDLKPDNVLFRKVPTMHMVGELRAKTQCISLIDFGQSIDMRTHPAGTTFAHVVAAPSQRCVAMREGRQWLYDVDWFGVANCAHTLLFGEYIDVERKPSGDFGIRRRIPRYWANEWWDELFASLLNMPAAVSQPGHPDNPVRRIIELGGETLGDKKTVAALSVKLIHLKTVMQVKRPRP